MDLAWISPVVDDEFVGKEAEGEEEDDETSMLLKPTAKGSMTENGSQRSRKVQWNDCSGSNLTEVLEFVPSDSSDSDDKYGGSQISNVMYINCMSVMVTSSYLFSQLGRPFL